MDVLHAGVQDALAGAKTRKCLEVLPCITQQLSVCSYGDFGTWRDGHNILVVRPAVSLDLFVDWQGLGQVDLSTWLKGDMRMFGA